MRTRVAAANAVLAIVGFVTRGRGVSVHRVDCANATSLGQEQATRLIDVEWDGARSDGVFRAGVEVVVLQGTMHPAARDLYDPALRGEFLAFARGLERDLGARFVPLERMPRLAESDFYDLIHTTPGGAAKLTRTLVRELERAGLPTAVSPS